MQDYALLVTVVFSGLLLYAYFFVIRNEGKKADLAEISKKGYTVRNRLFVGLLVLDVVVTGLILPRAFGPIAVWAERSDVQTIKADEY